MNKSGSVFLKILAVAGIIFAIILIVAGITLYQAYGVIAVVREEGVKIENTLRLFAEQKDCARLTDIETSMKNIEKKVSSACKNPILSFTIKQMENIPVKCTILPELMSDFKNEVDKAKLYCDGSGKLNESAMNGSMKREELMALAQKYGIKI